MKHYKIGITGGIGSGKSFVSAILVKNGVPVYDTDTAAKHLMLTDSVIRSGLIALLGEEAYDGNGLNKSLLAQYIFSNKDNAARINAIVHPRVYDDFMHWVAAQSTDVVGMESAILFESGFDKFVDKVLMISAPVEVRLERAMKRDKATRQQVISRMKAQLDDAVKLQKSHYVIVNDGVHDAEAQVNQFLSGLRQE